MSEPKTKIVHFRVPAELFDWSQRFWQSRGWSLAQYMRMLMLAQQEQTYGPAQERAASNLLAIAMSPPITKPTESPAVHFTGCEQNGH